MGGGQSRFGEPSFDRPVVAAAQAVAQEKAGEKEELAILGHRVVIRIEKMLKELQMYPTRNADAIQSLTALQTFAQGVSANSDQVSFNARRLLERITEDFQKSS